MFTIHNYFQKVKSINPKTLPRDLQEGYNYTLEITEQHTTWDYYESDNELKEQVDAYLADLNKYLNKSKANPVTEAEARQAAKNLIKVYVMRGDSYKSLRSGQMGSYHDEYRASIKGDKIHVMQVKKRDTDFKFPLQSIYNELLKEKEPKKSDAARSKPQPTQKTAKSEPSNNAVRVNAKDGKPVERIDEEVKFIKRYVLLHGKTKLKEQVLNFINALQRAIVEKRIRKTSACAKEIMYVQRDLLKRMKGPGAQVKFVLPKAVLDKFLVIAGSEKIRLSTQYLKRFIGIHGKSITKEKAKALHNLIVTAVNKGEITESDPYYQRLRLVLASLKKFVQVAKTGDTVDLHENVLSGLNNALAGCSCESDRKGLSGVGIPETEREAPKRTIMNSLDVIKLKSNKIGFSGKWLSFIGNPSKGFTMMIYGKPKFGKSILATELAGYLARNHGKVLYIAIEEGFEDTLKERLNAADIAHENLDVSDYIPSPIGRDYEYIFIDSVNRAGLSAKDLDELEHKYPGKSFVYVFQTTKDGDFKGAMEFKHNADVIIEVPELGYATQYGRYNQGGEMKIFR